MSDTIVITDQTKRIQPKNIKIELYLHQQVLVQQILDIIDRKFVFKDNQDIPINNKQIWLKGSIGTGKSLILLSVIQELKNNNYNQIHLDNIPVRNSLLFMIEHYDRNKNVNFLSKNCLYYKLINSNIQKMEINKEQGYLIEKHKKISIDYKQFKKQSMIFVQRQVLDQFKEYIETQTSLSYYVVNDGKSFCQFILNRIKKEQDNEQDPKQDPEKKASLQDVFQTLNQFDVILYDTNQMEPQNYLQNLALYLDNSNQEQYNADIQTIKQNYPNINNFNDFWQTWQELPENKQNPFSIVAFDDFDLIKFPNHFPIQSIWNIFVGSTMINASISNSNVCSNFILNDFIHDKVSLRIKEQQVQEILKLPKCHHHEVICSTPSQVYVQFKGLSYVQNIFQIISKIFDIKENNQIKPLKVSDYQDILQNKKTFQDIFLNIIGEYLLRNSPNSSSNNVYIIDKQQQYSISYLLDYLDFIKQLYEMNLICHQLKSKNIPQKVISDIIKDQFQLLPEPLTTFISQCEQSQTDLLMNNIANCPFSISQEEIDKNKLYNPFSDKPESINQDECYVSRCCGQMFNSKDLDKSIFYEDGQIKCSFCSQIINNINNQFLDIQTQRYIKTNIQFSKDQKKLKQIIPESKDQLLYKQIHELKKQGKHVLIFSKQINFLDLNKEKEGLDKLQEQLEKEVETQVSKEKIFEKVFNILFDYTDLIKCTNYGRNIFFNNLQTKQIKEISKRISRFTTNSTLQNTLKEIIQKPNLIDKPDIPDVLLVQSLDQIIGANITYIDSFIFYDVPNQTEEILQIIGRSRRIGRKEELDSYYYYYPLSKHVKYE